MAKGVGQGNRGKRGPEAPNWRGGQHIDRDGRVRIWDSDKKRYFHRSVKVWMEAHPGEVVPRGYVIHHLDGDRTNDVPENLVRLSLAEHVALHRRKQQEYIVLLQQLLRDNGIEFPPQYDLE